MYLEETSLQLLKDSLKQLEQRICRAPCRRTKSRAGT